MTEFQRYLAEEVAEDHADGLVSRREALRRLASWPGRRRSGLAPRRRCRGGGEGGEPRSADGLGRARPGAGGRRRPDARDHLPRAAGRTLRVRGPRRCDPRAASS